MKYEKVAFQMDSSDDESLNGEFYDPVKEEQSESTRTLNFDARISSCKINLLQVSFMLGKCNFFFFKDYQLEFRLPGLEPKHYGDPGLIQFQVRKCFIFTLNISPSPSRRTPE